MRITRGAERIAHEHALGHLACGDPGRPDPSYDSGALGLARKLDRERTQADRPFGRGRRAGAVPGVEPDVVVVAAGGHEQRARIAPDRDVEAEHAVVEGLGLGDVGHLEVDVPDSCARRRLRLELGCVAKLVDQTVEVERQGCHLQAVTRTRPLLTRAVAVDLDPVPIRVRQIERLADQVVGGAVERPAGLGQPGQREREVAPRRHEDRQVVEAGRAPVQSRRRAVAPQLDQRRLAGGTERERPVVSVARS